MSINKRILFEKPPYVACSGWITAENGFEIIDKALRNKKRSRELLIEALTGSRVAASARCIMTDYVVGPPRTAVPSRKNRMMKTVWYPEEGSYWPLSSNDFMSHPRDAWVTHMDLENSMLVRTFAQDRTICVLPEDPNRYFRAQERRVYYQVEFHEQSVKSLLGCHIKARSKPIIVSKSPDDDDYRLTATRAQQDQLIAPLLDLARQAKLTERFGVFDRGWKEVVANVIVGRFEAAGLTASKSTLLRHVNRLLEIDVRARETLSTTPSEAEPI